MNKVEYTVAFGVAYLTAVTLSGGDTLTVRVNTVDATLTFGNLRTKIKDGEGRVKFSELKDGVYDAIPGNALSHERLPAPWGHHRL